MLHENHFDTNDNKIREKRRKRIYNDKLYDLTIFLESTRLRQIYVILFTNLLFLEGGQALNLAHMNQPD